MNVKKKISDWHFQVPVASLTTVAWYYLADHLQLSEQASVQIQDLCTTTPEVVLFYFC